MVVPYTDHRQNGQRLEVSRKAFYNQLRKIQKRAIRNGWSKVEGGLTQA